MSGQTIGWVLFFIIFIILAYKKRDKIKEILEQKLELYKSMKAIESEAYRSQAMIEAHYKGVRKAKEKAKGGLGSNLKKSLTNPYTAVNGEKKKQHKILNDLGGSNSNLKKMLMGEK